MTYRVVLADNAIAEIMAAFAWIREESPTNADNWFNGLTATIDSLKTFPERCAVAPESTSIAVELRHLIYGRYRVIFTISDSTVSILHLRHSSRDYLTANEIALAKKKA